MEVLIDIETKEYCEYLLDLLSLREKLIIKMKYGIDCREMNYRQIAQVIHLSRTRIIQIVYRAIQKLKYQTSIEKYTVY